MAWTSFCCVGCVFCRQRLLRRADRLYRGVIPVVCVCVCVCEIVCDVQISTLTRPTTNTATYYLHSPIQYRGYIAFTKSQHYFLSDTSAHTYIKINGGTLSGVRHETYRCTARPNSRACHRFHLPVFALRADGV